MKTELILNKFTIAELLRNGFDPDTEVLIPEMDDISQLSNRVSAELSDSKAKLRTTAQNSSIHLYCKLLAERFNEAGLDMLAVLKVKSVSVPWSMEKVKDVLWREIQEALFNTRSTTKLDTSQVSQVHDVLNRHTGEKFGISLDFPNRFHGINYEE